jgi:hypothetical protein
MTKPENCGTSFCSCIECVNPDGPEWYLKQVDQTQGRTREQIGLMQDDRREGLGAHHTYCRVIGEDV